MIGSILAKRTVRSAFAMLNQGDVDAFFANWADESVWNFPPDVSVGGSIKGKKSIVEWFRRWMQQYPKRNFVLRNVCARDIFSFTATNVVTVEWDLSVTNKDGKDVEMQGVTVVEIRNFKAIRASDYFFDIAALKRAWGEA
jgi:ketosteroid isomerase-like protein